MREVMNHIKWITTCPACGKNYKNPPADHEGKMVICRCRTCFIMRRSAPHGKVGCTYNLSTKAEMDEIEKRYSLPLGMFWEEFIQLLYQPAILDSLCVELGKIRNKTISDEEMIKYIEYLEFERKNIRNSFE
jgi:hypothetical protein